MDDGGHAAERYQEARLAPEADLKYYIDVFFSRIFWFLIPVILVVLVGTAVVLLLRPVYSAQGKILVEAQQIPTELAKSTVTATAKERIEVLKQSVMTRENLLAIVKKYRMFGDAKLSNTDRIDLMRERAQIRSIVLSRSGGSQGLTIVVAASFESEQPQMAMRVANELVTLILSGDAENRASRAQETTSFLENESKRLESELVSVEQQIIAFKQRSGSDDSDIELSGMADLKAELRVKAAIYSASHPAMVQLRRQIAAGEKIVSERAKRAEGLQLLQNRRETILKNIVETTQKVNAARLGERLEKGQFAEKLRVLEHAVMPEKPIRPNRLKLLALVFAGACAAGAVSVGLIETLQSSIRGPRDLMGYVDAYLLVPLPYITTRRERRNKKLKVLGTIVAVLASGVAGLYAMHTLWKPLDEIWLSVISRVMG